MHSLNDKGFVDFYALLGVSRTASSREIEEACLRVGGALSPDTASSKDLGAAENFSLVEQAYETLTNAEARATYDRKLEANMRSASAAHPESAPPPHKREGILVMAASIAGAAITIAAAVVMIGPTPLGIASIVGLTTFRFLPYESPIVYTYLIELDATIVLLLCFLVGLYGFLVFLAVFSRPTVLLRRLAQLLSG